MDMIKLLKIAATVPGAVEKISEVLEQEISLPNIPFPTMGGKVFWDTLAQYNGWRLQQNEITKHCRILDPNDVRRAWGTKNGMIKALKAFKGLEI